MAIEDILNLARVIPVLTIDHAEDAVPLCSALAEGGLPVLEIALRTPVALPAVEMAAKALPDTTIGVGTLLDDADFARARDAGALFAVSPGLSMDLVAASVVDEIDYLPGVQTSSEAMSAYRSGIRALKFFPAKAGGGTYGLAQLAPLYPGLVFCPAGGISIDDAPDYLNQPNVACVGGSFASPNDLIGARNWTAITELARRAAAL